MVIFTLTLFLVKFILIHRPYTATPDQSKPVDLTCYANVDKQRRAQIYGAHNETQFTIALTDDGMLGKLDRLCAILWPCKLKLILLLIEWMVKSTYLCEDNSDDQRVKGDGGEELYEL